MKILITGAFGFVGSNLSAYLANKGYELWALDVKDSSKVLKCESSKVGDECDSAYSRSFTWQQLGEIPWSEVYAVVHLAGKAHDTKNTSDAQSYFDINTGLTKKILEEFSRKDAKAQSEEKKFILFSSVKAVADSVEGVLTEKATPNPKTPYGQSKLAAEQEVEKEVLKFESSKVLKCLKSGEVEKCASAGMRECASLEGDDGGSGTTNELMNSCTNELLYYILRPCMIHGPGNKGNLNLLYNIVRKGIPWPLGAFENQRSFASIENICAVVDGLLSKDIKSGAYHVADDDAVSTNDLIGMIAESQGRKARIWSCPKGVIYFVAKVGDLLHLPLNSERLKKLTESYVVSNAKVKDTLGWDKMPVGAKEGMLKTLKSFSRKGAKTQR